MKTEIKTKPTIFMIFGGTGDLAARKLIPALYNLFLEGHMPKDFAIVGLGRTTYTDETFIETLLEGVNKYSRSGKAKKDKWENFSKNIQYLKSEVGNDSPSPTFPHSR